MTDRLRIGIDFDGTLADSIGAAARYLEDLHGIVLESHERSWPPGLRRIGRERFDSMIVDDEFFDRLEFVSGAESVMRELVETADVFLVTARTERETEPVSRWLEARNLQLSGIASTSYYPKTAACRGLRIDVHFDDMLAHTADLTRETGTVLALLAAPWNDLQPTDGDPRRGEHRVHAGWEPFHQWLREAFADRFPRL